jgi:hypothetical protein
MGTSSDRLFGSDLACTIRLDYGDYLREGMTGREARKQILEDWADELLDTAQDGPVVWLALAVTQWKYGRLEPRIKAKALKIIRQGADVDSFPPNSRKRRSNELNKLRQLLESPQPPEKRVRVHKPPKPLQKIEEHWKPGQVVAVRRDSGQYILLVTEGVEVDDFFGQIPWFLPLAWKGAKLPTAERIRKLRSIQFAMGAFPNKKGQPIPWERIDRLDVYLKPSRFVYASSDGVYCKAGLNCFRWREFDKFVKERQELSEIA